MKTKLSALLLSATLSISTLASPSSSAGYVSQGVMDYCTALSELGEVVMTARQDNVELVTMIELANKSKSNDVYMYLITTAYRYDVYPTRLARLKSIQSFKESMMISCIRDNSK